MSNHNHNHCSHDLKYCEKCDVCYCTRCDREWGGHTHWTWYWGGTPYQVYTGVYTDNTKYSITYTNGEPVTDSNVLGAFTNSEIYKDVIGGHTNCIGHN
jgi:hypothetical protein